MNKTILASSLALALSTGAANASLTINAVHDTATPNVIEAYYIQANTSGSSNIFLSSVDTTVDVGFGPITLAMNGLLSVWQLSGSNWVLIGANDEAPRDASNSKNIYNVNVHQWDPADPTGGISDPGLTVNLIKDAIYLILQSDTNNGPTSLSNEQNLVGSLGQTIAVGSPFQAALWGTYDAWGAPTSGVQLNNYTLTITGDVSQVSAPPAAVPVPAAVWLFGSVLGGFGLFGRRKSA